MRTRLAFAAVVLAAVNACTGIDHWGHLRSLRDGSRVSLVLHGAPKPNGRAEAILPSGDRCRGEFRTVPDEVTDNGATSSAGEERTQTGMLLLDCRKGTLIRCEFLREPWGSGEGTCKDTQGAEYALTL